MAQRVTRDAISPGIAITYIIRQRDPTKVRSYNVFIVNPQVPFDQQGEIVKVFHLLKGNGNGDLEAHITLRCDVVGAGGSSASGFPITYELWEAES